ENGGTWLDVRLPDEYSNAMENSLNIPLADIRNKTSDLSTDRSYIICCDTGRRSAAAAFLLSQRGFEVNVLEGGLNALIPVNTPNPATITAAPAPVASPESNQPYDWSIEPIVASKPAASRVDGPPGPSELEALKQQRDELEKRIRELEMQLALKSITTTST
ncbi:MAG: hypothetical protein KAJ06_04265, partial [Gammaproteobacteria bacterium]|nr:hypothetical protein [Gammaproteobacteria bacterium]